MDCIVVGDIFFDLLVNGDPSKLGLVGGGTSYSRPIIFEFGGMGNVVVGLSRLGGKAQFIGKAGKDVLGNFYQENLIEEGVKAEILLDEYHPTGVIITFVDKEGERSFLISRGANDFLSPREVWQHKSNIQESKFLFVSGYSLVAIPQRKAIFEAVDIAKQGGVKVVFDPGAYNIVKKQRLIFHKLLNLCDVFTPNLEEAKALTEHKKIEDIAECLSKQAPLVALKIGKEGCMMITPNRSFECKASNANCVDSSGAGDAFVSALIYGLTRDFPLEITARLANWFASYNIQKPGARSFPDKNEIKNYLATLAT